MQANGGIGVVVAHVLLLLLTPALVIWAATRLRTLQAIGPVVICYGIGILWGNLGAAGAFRSTSLSIAEAAVPLAIPMLLYATDFMAWLRLARKTMLSFGLQLVAVMVASSLGAFLFRDQVAEWWQLAGMWVGVYTGGTANLTAIGLALGVSEETFILANAADIVVGSLYLLFLMSVAQRVLLRFLPPFKRKGEAEVAAGAMMGGDGGPGGSIGLGGGTPWREIGLGAALSAAITGVSAGIALVTTGRLSETVVILSITTLGLAVSFVPKVRSLRGTYDAGQYLLLVFCVAVGAMADFTQLSASPIYIYFCAFVVGMAVLLHFALAALFSIDADTVIITSVAGVFSPPFVGPVANALKNPEIVVSGLTTGVIGYAVGNYLGLALAYLLKP